MAKVILRNLYKKFKNMEVAAVHNVNLEIEDGEFICFLGPSGCGKTSTLRMIAGLEEITDGEIFINDRKVNNIHARDRGIAMVFENYALYKFLKVYDNIAFPLRVRGMSSKEINTKVLEVSKLLDIEDILSTRADSLSGGQQQRVGISRAIVRDAEVLLMDEPISHLEARLKVRTRRKLRHLQKQIGITTIYVTHDQLEAIALGDRIVIMNYGVVQQVGTPGEVLNHPKNIFVAGFIGEPPMNFIDGELVFENNNLKFIGEGINLFLPNSFKKGLNNFTLKSGNSLPVKGGIRPFDISLVSENEINLKNILTGVIVDIQPRNETWL